MQVKRVKQCLLEPLLEPMLEPLSALEPLAGTPPPTLEPSYCTLSAGGGVCAKDFCKKGTKRKFLKRTCSAFFFGPLWPRQG